MIFNLIPVGTFVSTFLLNMNCGFTSVIYVVIGLSRDILIWTVTRADCHLYGLCDGQLCADECDCVMNADCGDGAERLGYLGLGICLKGYFFDKIEKPCFGMSGVFIFSIFQLSDFFGQHKSWLKNLFFIVREVFCKT